MSLRCLTALPVYNEAAHVEGVLAEVRRYCPEVLVVDDGSRDATPEILDRLRGVQGIQGVQGIHVVRHPQNRGYGAALKTAFDFALRQAYDVLATIDCDGQHEPQRIPEFFAACGERDVDIVSGSRYLKRFAGDSQPPAERLRINRQITEMVNQRLGLCLTDAFCGFKAYRVPALAKLTIAEEGYGMPLELWVEAAAAGLKIVELPVPLIYLDENRSFGGALDDAQRRLKYYGEVLDRALERTGFRPATAQPAAACGGCSS